MATTFPSSDKAPHRQTPTHRPHPSHLATSMRGISIMFHH
jgi:hypothetical protein